MIGFNERRELTVGKLVFIGAIFGVACGGSSDGKQSDTETATDSADSDTVSWDIDELNQRLGKGINLGNALDAPTEGEWGVVLEEDNFKVAADAGFDSVRIPVRWSAHIATEEPYTIDEEFMARVDWAVDTALAQGLAVVLDVHHFEELMAEPEENIPVLKAIWKQLADHYKEYGPDLYFDLLNEPTGEMTQEQWNTLAAELVASVRETNPLRAFILEPLNSSNGSGLDRLELPEDDHLIVSFHYYEPFEFTHQNASWVEGSAAWLGTEWPKTSADIERIRTRFDDIQAWQEEQGVPIYVGEYGVIDEADTQSRSAWIAIVVGEFVQREWSSALWMFDASASGNFGIYNPETEEIDEDVVTAIMDPQSVIDDLDLDNLGDATVPDGPDVLLDDFEDARDDSPWTPDLSAALAEALSLDASEVAWIPLANPESEITNDEGTHVVTYQEWLETGEDLNVSEMIGPWGAEGAGLGVKIDFQSPQYPYAGITAQFIGEWNEYFFDFTDLTALSFKARGVGIFRADFVSDAVQNGYADGDNWGFHGQEFVLSEEWTQYVLYADDFTVMPWSPSAADELCWDDVKGAIFAIQLFVSSTYGQGAHESLEFYIDDIILHGLTLDDFEPVSVSDDTDPDAGTDAGTDADAGTV